MEEISSEEREERKDRTKIGIEKNTSYTLDIVN